MTLTLQNQLKLLYDLLDEHVIYKNGELTEFTQIKRLVQGIVSHEEIQDTELANFLPTIYNYGIEGEKVQCDIEHISSYEEEIYNWKNAIEKLTVSV